MNQYPDSKFPPCPFVDVYESELSIPPPSGTIITEKETDHSMTNLSIYFGEESDNILTYPYDQLPRYSEPTTIEHVDAIPSSSNYSSDRIVCGKETSKGHSCPVCFKYIHVICGLEDEGDDNEGFGSLVWCHSCDLKKQNVNRDKLRLGIKRNQEHLHNRMLCNSTNSNCSTRHYEFYRSQKYNWIYNEQRR